MKNIPAAAITAGLWIVVSFLAMAERQRRRKAQASGCIDIHIDLRAVLLFMGIGIAYELTVFFLSLRRAEPFSPWDIPHLLSLAVVCIILFRRITIDPARGCLTVCGLLGKRLYLISQVTEIRSTCTSLAAFSDKKLLFFLFNTRAYKNSDIAERCLCKMSGCKLSLPEEYVDFRAAYPDQPLATADGQPPSLYFRCDAPLPRGALSCPPHLFPLCQSVLHGIAVTSKQVSLHFEEGICAPDRSGNAMGQTAPCEIRITPEASPSITAYILRQKRVRQLSSERLSDLLKKGGMIVTDASFPPLCGSWMLTGKRKDARAEDSIILYFSGIREMTVQTETEILQVIV